MSFLSSAIESQKRKRAEINESSTIPATPTTGPPSKGPAMPKFQRRGAAAASSSTTTNTNTQTNNTTLKPADEANTLTPHDGTETMAAPSLSVVPVQSSSSGDAATIDSLQTVEKQPELDPEEIAAVMQLQQDRLDELSLARLDRYKLDRAPSSFSSVHLYETWALKRYLWLWEQDLVHRPREEADGFYGRKELQDYNECRRDLRPLLQQLKTTKIKTEILLCVANVLEGLSTRDYIKAEQAFLDVAIGNNPWPVGLPKVGIHERRAREKIDPSLVDHLLKDPTIQAYMQSLKRLMAWVAKKFPTQ